MACLNGLCDRRTLQQGRQKRPVKTVSGSGAVQRALAGGRRCRRLACMEILDRPARIFTMMLASPDSDQRGGRISIEMLCRLKTGREGNPPAVLQPGWSCGPSQASPTKQAGNSGQRQCARPAGGFLPTRSEGFGGQPDKTVYFKKWRKGGIRTHEGLSPLAVFKTAAFNRSATSPEMGRDEPGQRAASKGGHTRFSLSRLASQRWPPASNRQILSF